MTDNNQTEVKPDFSGINKFLYASIAGAYYQEKNPIGAKKSLDKLVEDIKPTGEYKKYLEYMLGKEHGMVDSINYFTQEYETAKNELSVKHIPVYFNMEKLVSDDKKDKLNEVFGGFGDEKLKDINRKYLEANNIVENAQLYSEDEINKAKEQKKKYEKIYALATTFDKYMIKKIKYTGKYEVGGNSVEDETMKELLNNVLSN